MSPFKKVTVFGAGVMGHSLALLHAQAAEAVCLVDTSPSALQAAAPLMRNALETLDAAGELKESPAQIMERISFHEHAEDCLSDTELVIEAISENPDAEHAPKTPLALYERDMRDMIRLARRKNMAVALCTLPPIISESCFDFFSAGRLNRDNILRWLGDTNKIYRYHERYSLLLSRLARDCACRLLDLRSAFLEKWDPHPYFCRDGIHPNNDGQMLIRDAVLAQIG